MQRAFVIVNITNITFTFPNIAAIFFILPEQFSRAWAYIGPMFLSLTYLLYVMPNVLLSLVRERKYYIWTVYDIWYNAYEINISNVKTFISESWLNLRQWASWQSPACNLSMKRFSNLLLQCWGNWHHLKEPFYRRIIKSTQGSILNKTFI